MADQGFHGLRRGDDAVKTHSGVDAQSVEQINQVLGGEVPGRAWRVGASAEPPGRRSNVVMPASGSEARRSQGGAARVVKVQRQPVRGQREQDGVEQFRT